MDVVLNGVASGTVASVMLSNGFDANGLRPYIDTVDGQERSFLTVNKDGQLQQVVTNAPATLRKDDWKLLDSVVVKAAKERLRVVSDIRRLGLVFNLPNGMAHTVLETESQSDISDAAISMDGLRQSQSDRPQFELKNLPLPIIHKDFHFSARQLAASRNGGSPLDTTNAELAARRVAESAERLVLGVYGTYQFGGGTVYGMVNHPNRQTQLLTAPTTVGWTPDTLVNEVLAMRKSAYDSKHYGPYGLYFSLDWDEYLDRDYSSQKGDNTLRQRLAGIRGISFVETADYLGGWNTVLVQLTSDVIREVVGMDITTVQWESQGGMQINFKVMAILTPQLRADYNGNMGLVHGNV